MEEEEKKSILNFESEPLMSNSQEKIEIETSIIDIKEKREDTREVENDKGFQKMDTNNLLEENKAPQEIKGKTQFIFSYYQTYFKNVIDDETATSLQYEENKVEKIKDEVETINEIAMRKYEAQTVEVRNN